MLIDQAIELRQNEIKIIEGCIEEYKKQSSALLDDIDDLDGQRQTKQFEIVSLDNEIRSFEERKTIVSRQLCEIQKIVSEKEKMLESIQAQFLEVNTCYQETLQSDKNLKAEIESLKLKLDDSKLQFEQLSLSYLNALEVHDELKRQVDLFKDTLDISEYGLYQSKFSFDLPEQYRLELEHNYQKQKIKIGSNTAVSCYTQWTVGGSEAEGRKMTKQYTKLMLYAFNGECDGLIAKVKWNNASKTELRIIQAFNSINKLGSTHNITITQEYLNLKVEELSLTYEYEQKKYEEKEEQRQIKEQMREEEKAQKEFEKAQRDAEDEERKYQKAIEKVRQELSVKNSNPAAVEVLNEKIKLLELSLQEAQEKKVRAISLAQMTKVGHIYVISNIGSFGEDVYKIGMTRRLDPLDRVRELGDASVPFQFDIHAIIYSENAPQLEYELHQKFKERRLNRINSRKEFFKVTLDEIESFVREHANAEIEFTKLAEAREYRETLTLLEKLNSVIEQAKKEEKFPKSLM